MPSPRQILTDITDLGLDPARAHSQTSTSGNLRPNVVETSAPVVVSLPKAPEEERAPKNALVEVLVEEPKKKEKKAKKPADVSEDVVLKVETAAETKLGE